MIEKTSRFLIEICKKIFKIEKSTIIQSLKVIFIGSGNILGKIAWKVSGTPEMKRLIKKNDQIVVKF